MTPDERAKELRLGRSEMTGKMLEIQVELSRIRKLWLVEGVQTPIQVRASLDHQLVELELKRHHRVCQERGQQHHVPVSSLEGSGGCWDGSTGSRRSTGG